MNDTIRKIATIWFASAAEVCAAGAETCAVLAAASKPKPKRRVSRAAKEAPWWERVK